MAQRVVRPQEQSLEVALSRLAPSNALGASIKFEVDPRNPSPTAHLITDETRRVSFRPENSTIQRADKLRRVAEALDASAPPWARRATVTFDYDSSGSSALGRWLASFTAENIIFERDANGRFNPISSAVPRQQ